MIIYGTRMYGRKNEIRTHGRCGHCGKTGRLQSYDGRKWGHLYFIPIIPEGGKVRVLRECSRCHTGSHIPIDKVPGIISSLQKTMDSLIVALGANEADIIVDGQSRPVAAQVAANLDDVYCLSGANEVAQVLANLKAIGADDELLLAEAKLAELNGQINVAAAKYDELTGRSSQSTMLYIAAQFYRDAERFPQATALAERLEKTNVTDLAVKQLLIDCYLATQDWRKLAATYENCFLIAPALKQEKPLMKLYRKACKKAGVTAQT